MPVKLMSRFIWFTVLVSTLCSASFLLAAERPNHLLLRNPSISQKEIVFEYANDLWIVPRDGGNARRLTAGSGRESDPHFSPDGTQIAFSGEYEGNVDVYVVSAGGGVPRRLTYHPDADYAMGWTPDGKRVLFSSRRDSFADSGKLYAIGLNEAMPVPLPLAAAEDGSYSPDGSHIAYEPVFHWQSAWKQYHGGQTLKIWLADLADSSIVPIPRENSNDFNPMWVRNKVYFLSDRSGATSLFVYDLAARKVSEVFKNESLDLKSASATQDAIVV